MNETHKESTAKDFELKLSRKITRRKALAATASVSGAMCSFSCSHEHGGEDGTEPPRSRWQESVWTRGPDTNMVRDLTPGPTPLRLACVSESTRLSYPEDRSITEVVKSIRDQGYTSAGDVHPPFRHNKWLDASDSEISELKTALRTYDITFFDMMTFDNIVHPDRNVREKGIKHVTENMEAAEKCGALSVCAGLGSCDPDFGIGIHPENWTEETWELGVRGIRQILRDTTGFKAVLGMEAVVTTPLDGPVALKRFQEDVGDPRCQVALDPANMFTIANYYHSTEMINMCFDLLGESIVCCHAKDTLIERDQMLVIMAMKPAGKGIQDYESYLVNMSRMQYPRTLLLEFAKPDEYPAVKAFLEKIARKVGVKIYT